MPDYLLEARVLVYSRDLGIYLTAAIYLGMMQLLLWGMARHSADIDLWRTAAFCLLVGGVVIMGMIAGSLQGVLASAFAGCLMAWIILGVLFDLETWQRVVLTIAGPVAVPLAYFLGYGLKGLIFQGMLG